VLHHLRPRLREPGQTIIPPGEGAAIGDLRHPSASPVEAAAGPADSFGTTGASGCARGLAASRWPRKRTGCGRAGALVPGAVQVHRAARGRTTTRSIFFNLPLHDDVFPGLPPVQRKRYSFQPRTNEWPIYFGMWDRLVELPASARVSRRRRSSAFMRRRLPRARPRWNRFLGVAG